MTNIQAKYNVGNTLYTLGESMKIETFKVEVISIFVSESGINIYYKAEGEQYDTHKETHCFPTKEDLLDYIQN